MSTYRSREELEDFVDWEGGPAAFIFSYGLTPESLPEGTPPDVAAAVTRLAAPGNRRPRMNHAVSNLALHGRRPVAGKENKTPVKKPGEPRPGQGAGRGGSPGSSDRGGSAQGRGPNGHPPSPPPPRPQ